LIAPLFLVAINVTDRGLPRWPRPVTRFPFGYGSIVIVFDQYAVPDALAQQPRQ
jgi:hypothetical protein